MKKRDAQTLISLIEHFNKTLSGYRLDEILEALSKGCMAHCKDMLNAEMTEDTNGNTLKALFDFSDRIHRLARSSRCHNKQTPVESRMWSKDDRIKKEKVYRKDYEPRNARDVQDAKQGKVSDDDID
jgi:hypothetical protein